MAGKLAPNSSRLTRGLVKHVPGRGYFRAMSSQNGDKYATSPARPQSLNWSCYVFPCPRNRLKTLNLIRLIKTSGYYTSYRLGKAPKVGTETRFFARPQLHAQASPDRHQRLIVTAEGRPCQRCNRHIFWWKNGGDIAAESEPFDMRRINQDRF